MRQPTGEICVTHDQLWGDSASGIWLEALSLPILPWAKPFLPILGLPDALLHNPEIWVVIHAEAVLEYKT
ncbi:MAG TPA: hypothetical protein DD379_19955 [Cyanobacteria bacterium UBA11162]|nr:hypothetical protein [Cyanobacteria bacterium UBA11162]